LKNIFITEGDPAGISYEIFDGAINLLLKKSKRFRFIFISSQNKINSKFEKDFKVVNSSANLEKALATNVKIIFYKNSILTKQEDKELKIGNPSTTSGKVAYASLITGIALQKILGGDIITLPLSKEWVIKSGIKDFKGHTEVFASEYERKTFMLMHGNKLKVIPLTTHIPLKDVSHALRKLQIVPLIKAIQNSKLLESPKIAVCGLNPHAGENGKIGSEEIEILEPFIKEIRRHGLSVEGPISADSLFIPSISKNFDLIFACYHDQGLIPFKSMEGKNGINVTLGLDFLRVSPDHGTAFDIAGKNLADPGSLIQCIKVLTKHDIH
jgi:4-hydroxythreonine-4-phosphate dehydrogenase